MKIEITREYTVRNLINGYQNLGADGVYALENKLEVRPPYQREQVYGIGNDKDSKVIESILGGGEHAMQRHRQFHRAQIGGQMTAGAGDGVHHLLPQLGTQVGELSGIPFFNILGRPDVFQSLHNKSSFNQ